MMKLNIIKFSLSPQLHSARKTKVVRTLIGEQLLVGMNVNVGF